MVTEVLEVYAVYVGIPGEGLGPFFHVGEGVVGAWAFNERIGIGFSVGVCFDVCIIIIVVSVVGVVVIVNG